MNIGAIIQEALDEKKERVQAVTSLMAKIKRIEEGEKHILKLEHVNSIYKLFGEVYWEDKPWSNRGYKDLNVLHLILTGESYSTREIREVEEALGKSMVARKLRGDL